MQIPSFFQLYNEFISIPTISSLSDLKLDHSNKFFIDRLASYFSELGFEIEIDPVPNCIGKYNLLATYSNDENKTMGGLLLSGHSDTVPFDENGWSKNPFKLTEENNRWYGLGTADMKGFFAFILETLKQIDLNTLNKPLFVLATADEEITMNGAIHFASKKQIQPDCVIIGEPTSLIPIRAHKGFTGNSIQVIGRSGHSSDPDQGLNAIEVMHQIITRLLQLKAELKEKYHNVGFTIPYPTMNLGTIHGGDAANRICGCCELVLDIRPLPEMDVNQIQALLTETLTPLMQKYPNAIRISNTITPTPGYECGEHDPVLCVVESIAKNKAQTVCYSTEAPFLQQLAPTMILGPGSIAQAHQPDEFVSMDQFKPTIKTIQGLIKQFCL